MDSKDRTLREIMDCGIVAVVRVGSAQEALEVCRAIAKGGVKPVEVTMTVPNAIDVIKEFKSMVKDEVLVGAGTVLDPETARAAILAGAEYVVMPTLNLRVIELCHRYGKVVVPGTFTPTEILTAWEAGADIVKVFPAGVAGPQYLRDIKAPLPQVRLMPTGGVTLENTPDFIKAGAVAVAVGAALVDRKAVAEKKYDIITEKAKQFVEAVKKARAG